MRGRGVDHPHIGAFQQGDRLACRIVGQAQDHGVGAVQRIGAGARVLAALLRQADERDIRPAGEAFPDFEARRARRAVYENLVRHMCILRRAMIGSA